MFFILSKLLYILIKPTTWLIFALCWLLYTKNEQKRRKRLIGLLVAVLVMTNPLLSNRIFHAWEWAEVPIESLKVPFEVGIVLTGFSDIDAYISPDRLNFKNGANRLTDAVVLYKRGLIKKILITGGYSDLTGETINEADLAEAFLQQVGIPKSDIYIENQSRNTRENAVFTKLMLEKLNIHSRCLLITSASHLRRSVACFEQIGMEVTPFPCNFVAKRLQGKANSLIIPSDDAFVHWKTFVKEWIGWVVYKMQGYI
jgi:uncharacterized SAM-binding protein YcdF (DUF218 family)